MYYFKNDLVLLWKAWVFGALFKLVQGTEDRRNIMGLKKVLRGIIINSMLLCFHELFLQFYFLLRNFSCIDITGLLKIYMRLKHWKKSQMLGRPLLQRWDTIQPMMLIISWHENWAHPNHWSWKPVFYTHCF